jgi:hypothetical protein
MPTISVSQEVYEELKKRSQSWEDTPTRIIARLLGMNGSQRVKGIEGSSSAGTAQVPPTLDNPGNAELLPSSPPPPRPIDTALEDMVGNIIEKDRLRKDRASPSSMVRKIIMIVLAEEGLGMIDPQLVMSETKKIMELNGLLGDKDLETTPSGKTRLEIKITQLQRESISEGLASSAEGMWFLTKEGLEESKEIKENSRLLSGKENNSNQLPSPKVTYRHTRLCFLKEKIENLEAEDAFRIICPDGVFQMTKNEFYEVFDNIVSTHSYRDRGIYHSPRPPRKAMQFKIL